MASKETSIALSRAAGWQALMGVYALFVLNELLPVIFGSGENASWDWSFIFVTLRIIIVPLAVLLCLGANVAAAIREKRLSSPIVLRSIGAATLACGAVLGSRGSVRLVVKAATALALRAGVHGLPSSKLIMLPSEARPTLQ